ncbi:MAG TPA: urease accessory protein UreD [Puia sp.]|nr:urease accessory protein UreD [Puia sp.]
MISKVHIQAGLRDGISFLRRVYYTPPFKVADITEDRKGGPLQLMLMCSSPGILDEDEYEMKLELEEACSLQLHTQSYQRLFDMKKGASQTMEIRVGKGASFCYLPHPCVPHANSIYTGRNRIFLSEGSGLIWGEVLTCGRKLSGESFQYSRYQSMTEVFIKGRLALRDNICLRPSITDIHGIGQLEGFTHQGSLLFLREGPDPHKGKGEGPGAMQYSFGWAREEIESLLLKEKDIAFGISSPPGGGWIVRILGNRAEQLHACLKKIALIAEQTDATGYLHKPTVYAS